MRDVGVLTGALARARSRARLARVVGGWLLVALAAGASLIGGCGGAASNGRNHSGAAAGPPRPCSLLSAQEASKVFGVRVTLRTALNDCQYGATAQRSAVAIDAGVTVRDSVASRLPVRGSVKQAQSSNQAGTRFSGRGYSGRVSLRHSWVSSQRGAPRTGRVDASATIVKGHAQVSVDMHYARTPGRPRPAVAKRQIMAFVRYVAQRLP